MPATRHTRPAGAATDLIGRTREVQAIGAILTAGRGMLALVGEPGIGKTALLGVATRRASDRGWRVLSVTGVPAEAQLPFAGLHQLLRPVMDSASDLPEAERVALQTAFGLRVGPAPEFFLIARAGLTLLTAAAARDPVLIVVDDLQWLDDPSYRTITYIARRASTPGVAMLIAARAETGGPARDLKAAGVQIIVVDGVDDDAAQVILRGAASHLPGPDRRRIQAEARGNPLALLELPAAWHPGQAGAADEFPTLSARLERAFAGRIAELPPDARDLLLVGALDNAGALAEIRTAAAILHGGEIPAAAEDAAARLGLICAPGATLEFRHPLVRSGVVHAEPVSRRQAAHAALAQARGHDPLLRAWHRAQSITGPDDGIADELAATVPETLGRGAVMSAIGSLERSAQLTADSALRGKRFLMAAEHAFGLGRVDLVDRLVQAAARTDLSELDWARMQWLREIFNDGVPGDATRVIELCDIASVSADAADVDLALNLLLGAALRCWWADTGPAARARVVAVAEGLPGVQRDPRFIATLAVAEPVARAAAVTRLLERIAPPPTLDAGTLRLLGMASHAIGDEPRAADFLDAAETQLRSHDQLGLLAHVLSMQVIIRLELGDWDRAEAAADEGRLLAEETGQPIWTAGTIVCEARAHVLRGNTERALELVAEAELSAHRQRLNDLLACAQVVRGIACLTQGRPADAYAAFRAMFDPTHPSFHQRERFDGVMYLAEVATAAGRREDAREVVDDLTRVAATTPSPLLRTQLAYARAVLAPDEQAEPNYRAALDADDSRWPWIRARLELAFGSWLLGQGRDDEAGSPLRSARDTFATLGAQFWRDLATAELHRIAELRRSNAAARTPGRRPDRAGRQSTHNG